MAASPRPLAEAPAFKTLVSAVVAEAAWAIHFADLLEADREADDREGDPLGDDEGGHAVTGAGGSGIQ